ncbi:MAG: PqqD family protein [Xanthobacteraceae bacterium]
MTVRRKGDWLIARVGEHVVMMSREKVHHIGVTEAGARIWELIETPQEVERKEYAIQPDVCRAEVDAFLDELVGHGAATFDRPSAA